MAKTKELNSNEKEFMSFVATDKAKLWLENKKLKAALEKAAKIIAKNICPADYEGYNCPLLADTDIECTQDIAEQCLNKFLLREDGWGVGDNVNDNHTTKGI
jgi:hypothetical protein